MELQTATGASNLTLFVLSPGLREAVASGGCTSSAYPISSGECDSGKTTTDSK